MKKIAILNSNPTPKFEAIKHNLQGAVCLSECPDNCDEYDLIVAVDFDGELKQDILCCHHSLLPAFDTDEPAIAAFAEGVKVTGITIYFSQSKNIIAQYPAFIDELMLCEELEQELDYLEQVLFPIVINKYLSGEPLESRTLLKSGSCENNCKECGGCHH